MIYFIHQLGSWQMDRFFQPVIFDLEIEAAVGGGGGVLEERRIIFTPLPQPTLHFLPSLTTSAHSLPLKSKTAVIIFAQKMPNTRPLKLRLLRRRIIIMFLSIAKFLKRRLISKIKRRCHGVIAISVIEKMRIKVTQLIFC